ncbi:MAG TPA: AAA family ATPase [Candidatus Kapabacteria bacterium]|nr:AAA family ATPase [Candidatus Kapabacteria bacterium]
MTAETVKHIPYGVSDYARIVQRNYYYVDKTPYLAAVEKAGDYLFLIRPRRFGKSLFVAVMESYYDVLYKNRFEELFKRTWIYEHPTEERAQYLTLVLNFSAVDPDLDKVETSFLHHVQMNAVAFVHRYRDFLSHYKEVDYYARAIKESLSASDILSNLITLCKEAGRKLYVIIDEYDNFSNIILSTVGKRAYHSLTHGAGFFRSFFNILKSGTTRTDSPISRLFITGVSPVTMDDVTSGFNIGKNVSMEPAFNRALGFTGDDVIEMIEYYRANDWIKHPTDYLLAIMTEWYGNYLFSEYGDGDTRMFNSDMVLYFMDNYFIKYNIPLDLIDRNVRIDYKKLKHLIILDRGKTKVTNGNFSKLKEIIEEGGTSAKIVKGFPLENMMDANNFKSLLFYLGLLTIKEPERDKLRLEIPNELIKRLYYDYIEEAYRETNVFAIDLSEYSDLMSDMAYDGKWEPLVQFITTQMKKSMSLRDLITGEKSIQAFLNVYLGLSDLYIIHTEKEMNQGYADILMEPFLARYEGIKYSYLIEIKYIKSEGKRKPGKPLIDSLKKEAEAQLGSYSFDGKSRKSLEKTALIKIILIFSGHELVYLGSGEEKMEVRKLRG